MSYQNNNDPNRNWRISTASPEAERLARGFQVPHRCEGPEYGPVLARMKAGRLLMPTAASIPPAELEWAIHRLIPIGQLTALAAPPKNGKTTLATALCASVTTALPIQGLDLSFAPRSVGRVIYITREDDVAATIIPRLSAAGANLDLVEVMDHREPCVDGRQFAFNNEQHLQLLADKQHCSATPIKLIILDPIYLAVDGDHMNNSNARIAYERLSKLARDMRCAIVGVAHTVRSPKGKAPLARVSSPAALREVPRSIIVLDKIAGGPTETGGTHVLVLAAGTHADADIGFEYCIEPKTVQADMPGHAATPTCAIRVTKTLSDSADDVLARADTTEAAAPLRKSDIAKDFLLQALRHGPRTRNDLDGEAILKGIAKGTLNKARTDLNIQTRKRQGDGLSEWFFPESP